jgi:hypothetical protein
VILPLLVVGGELHGTELWELAQPFCEIVRLAKVHGICCLQNAMSMTLVIAPKRISEVLAIEVKLIPQPGTHAKAPA